jgi:hypothetical protein
VVSSRGRSCPEKDRATSIATWLRARVDSIGEGSKQALTRRNASPQSQRNADRVYRGTGILAIERLGSNRSRLLVCTPEPRRRTDGRILRRPGGCSTPPSSVKKRPALASTNHGGDSGGRGRPTIR